MRKILLSAARLAESITHERTFFAMKMTNKQYDELVKEKSPNSPLWKNMIFAFLIGGAICTVGQGVKNLFEYFKLDNEAAATATSIIMVFLGAFFTGINVYDKLAKLGGAGTLVPITGFANAVVSPAMEFKSEGIVTGLCAKMFTIAGPVIVFGTIGSALYGVLLAIIN